jgi:uncharacterized protein YcbX
MLNQINLFDQRRVVNDAIVELWTEVFENTDAADADRAVRDYYLTTPAKETISPGHILQSAAYFKRVREEQQRAAENSGGTSCGKKGCTCTHTDGCEAGWIETSTRDERGVTYDQVKPCPRCRGDVATIAASAKNRQHFQSLIRDKSLRSDAADEHQSAHAWDD